MIRTITKKLLLKKGNILILVVLVLISFTFFLTRTSYKDIITNVTNYHIYYGNLDLETNTIEVKVSFDLDNFNRRNHLSAQCFNNPIRSDKIIDFSESKKVSLVDDTYEVIFNVPMEYEYKIILFETAQDGVSVALQEIPIKHDNRID